MTTAAPRRQLSPRAAQALAAGRQRRAQQLDALREQRETSEQPETPEPETPSQLTPAALTSEPETSQATQASSAPSPTRSVTGSLAGNAEGLRIAFDDSLPEEREAKPSKRPAVKRAQPAPRSSSHADASTPKSGPAKAQAKPAHAQQAQPWVNEREERIRYQAERDAPTLAKTLIAAAGWLIDKQAAPSEELADDMAQPALRLLYRHFPSLMELSPDAKDGGELIMATLIWSEQVAAFRKSRQYSRGESRVRNAPGHAPVVNFPQPAQTPYRGAGQPAYEAGGGRYAPGADASSAAGVSERSAGAGYQPSLEAQSFAELGIDL